MTSYAYDFMDVKKFHDEGLKGQGIKVAVMDSGIQKHTDLIVKGGVNTYNNSLPYDADLNNSHGTMVAGIIGSQSMGIAPDCDLYAIRIDDGVSTVNNTQWSEQIDGMDWAISNGMDVVICSFSGYTESTQRKEAFKRAYDAGIAIFCSAGNKQSGYPLSVDRIGYPSRYPFVVTTANIDENKTRYPLSCVGSRLNFANGGVNVRTTTIDKSNAISNRFGTGLGTSYANPATAGLYVLYKQKYPNDSREKILQRMYINAENIGDSWEYGAGIPKYPNISHKNIVINRRVVQ